MLRRFGVGFIAIARFGRRTEPFRIVGTASVIDGDSILVAGQEIRLHGIDAPEWNQSFLCRGRKLPCGAMATAVLEALIAGVRLECRIVERDRHGRLVAKCFSPSGIDIGRRMVATGWALAYRRYSMDYVDAEAEARKAKRGLWQGRFEKPWAWRASMARQVPIEARALRQASRT